VCVYVYVCVYVCVCACVRVCVCMYVHTSFVCLNLVCLRLGLRCAVFTVNDITVR